MLSIIEQSIISKRSDGKECEDGLFISNDFLAVVDGVTPKGKWKWDGHTSGYFAKEAVMKGLKELEPEASAHQAIEHINKCIHNSYTQDRLEKAKLDGKEQLQACVIIYSVAKQQIWSFGDCQCIINCQIHTHEKQFDVIVSKMRSLYLELEKLCGKTEEELAKHDTGREFIMPVLEKENMLANSDTAYGFDNLNGFELCFDRMKVYDINEGDQIVLASDGYPSLQPTLKSSERLLKEVLQNDPLCYKTYLSTKGYKPENVSFDDRTYIRFTI